MRTLLIALGLALAACGGGGGSSGGGSAEACASFPFTGTYEQNSAPWDKFVFRTNCTGSNTNCSYTYTHNNPGTSLGQLDLTVTTATGGGGCPTAGQTVSCTWSIPGASQLILNCDGGGNIQYSKIAN
jgi:hypothetical protein